ncbi:MAG: TonB-dependent receptor, partial [Alkalimonas sp.]|nr:TonB-dependent receptor [Alkalimonas sp.]
TGVATGTVYGDDTQVQQLGRWVVLKDIDAFTNDLALSHTTDQAVYTVGYFDTRYSVKDWWSIGNQAWHVLAKGGELLSGIGCNDSLQSCSWNYDIDSTGDGHTRALYAAAEYQINDQWRVDAGIRNENHSISYVVDEGLNGQISKAVDYDESKIAWTAGVNWMWQRNMGMFVRANRGQKMPYFDDFRDNFDAYTAGDKLINEITQYELGYKWAEQNYSLYLTAFINEAKGETFVARPGAPAEVLTTEARGVEVDFNFMARNGLAINLNSTLQQTEITNHPDDSIVGNRAMRQPRWQARVTPSYGFDLGTMFATVYGTVSAVSDRYADNSNSVTLKGYSKIDLGMQLEVTDQLTAQLSVANLTDKNGLTEGDPRNPTAPNGRYIMPRSAEFSISYRF